MKKKRTRKYVPRSLQARLVSWESERSASKRFVTAQEKRGFVWVNLSGEESYQATCKPRNWTLVIRAIEWHASGEVDIYPVVAHFHNVTLKTLESEAKAMRKKAIKNCDEKRLVDVGWAATTFDHKPVETDYSDVVDLGVITQERQMLWNNAWREEVRAIAENETIKGDV